MAVGEMAVARVEVLGPLTVRTATGTRSGSELGSLKARQVLLQLAASAHRPVSAEVLADRLWPDEAPERPTRVVASLVSRLRARLGRETILGDGTGYRLSDLLVVDVDEARDLVAEAQQRRLAGQPGLAVAAADRATALLGAAPPDDLDTAGTVAAEGTLLIRRARLLAATARLDLGRYAEAVAPAAAAFEADALDESAARVLMSAQARAGDVAAAVRTYAVLRAALRDALGADPSPTTADLHTALLRGDPAPPAADPLVPPAPIAIATGASSQRPARLPLAGRTVELGHLESRWAAAAAGRGGIALVTGEAGIGKTRLADELAEVARRTGGLVLEARCFEAERSLLLQPLAEAIAGVAARLPPDVVRTAAAGREEQLLRIVPSLAALVPADRIGRGTAQHERELLLVAVADFLGALARRAPVLLSIDDLHNAGSLTVEAIHYLRLAAESGPLLVVATVRPVEGAETLRLLEPVADRVELGPLGSDAIHELAAAAGHVDHADEIERRTRGHSLFVVEILRDLRAGGDGRPPSLQAAVLSRLARCGPGVERLLRAASVLGSVFDPLVAAALSDELPAEALADCETALAARLLTDRGALYEFANDLVRDAVYAALPEPTRIAQHRRAADLMVDQPEALAWHAAAAGQQQRACLAWLLAAENALSRFAAKDAEALAQHALVAATALGDEELHGRALLARGNGRNAQSSHEEAHADFAAAARAARRSGNPRLEMVALRASSGDVNVTVAQSLADIEQPLDRVLEIARSLGNRAAEADALSRLTVLATARLDFVLGDHLAGQAERVAASSTDPLATTHALDARKHVLAYLGMVRDLPAVTSRLEPVLRGSGDLWSLQWTVFESAFVPLAAEDYPSALAVMTEALEINRRSGFVASESWHLAHIAWLHRLSGDLPAALHLGAHAVDRARRHGRHRWWLSAAAGLYAASLLAHGRADAARSVLLPLRPTGEAAGDEAYRLRLLAPLAEATGSDEDLVVAHSLHSSIRTPPGHAWLLGADAYLSLARAWQARDDSERAAQVLEPFVQAASTHGWPALARSAATLLQRA